MKDERSEFVVRIEVRREIPINNYVFEMRLRAGSREAAAAKAVWEIPYESRAHSIGTPTVQEIKKEFG